MGPRGNRTALGAVIRFLHRLRRDQSGQVAYLVLFALIPITAFLMIIADTGQKANDRARAQSAVDAIALAHAKWTARSLNTISLNNIALTQSFVVAMSSEALEDAMEELDDHADRVLAYIRLRAAKECQVPAKAAGAKAAAAATATGVGSVAAAAAYAAAYAATLAICIEGYVQVYGAEAKRAQKLVSDIRSKYNPGHARATAERAIRALNAANQSIIDAFPAHIEKVASELAERNGLDAFYFFGRCRSGEAASCRNDRTPQGLSLPIESGTQAAKRDFCAGTEFGTGILGLPIDLLGRVTYEERGFPGGLGPLRSGGDTRNPHVQDHINEITGIGNQIASFYKYYSKTRMHGLNPPCSNCIGFPPGVNYIIPQTKTLNGFTGRMAVRFRAVCHYFDLGDFVASLFNSLSGMDIVMPVMYAPIGSQGGLTPPRSVDEMPDQFRALTLGLRNTDYRLGSDEILDDPLDANYVYAQSVVFNPEGYDLYSQVWTAKMMPATRFSNPSAVANELSQRGPTAFSPLIDHLRDVRDTGSWGQINVH